MPQEVKEKISLFCDVPIEAVVEGLDARTIYEVPLAYEQAGLGDYVVRRLGLEPRKGDLKSWETIVHRITDPKSTCRVAVVGKYTSNGDAYKSIAEALVHAGVANHARVDVEWIESDRLEHCEEPAKLLEGMDGLVVAPGFGGRGIEGKILALQHVRENGIPFLGICLGMQLAVIEFARHVCELEEANSSEFSETTRHPVIDLLPEQKGVRQKGASMRLGSYPCNLTSDTLAHRLYGELRISERHRHRYEVNNDYRELLISRGLVVSGVSPDYRLVEMVELPNHPFFVGTQAHPEFKSRPDRPHPLFIGLVAAAVRHHDEVNA